MHSGAICYLDEIVEVRKDTTVVIHTLADDRRVLPMEQPGEVIEVGPEFCLAISCNPGYQSVLKDLKQSTRQSFVALEFDYPSSALEAKILVNETGIDKDTAGQFINFAQMMRNLKGSGWRRGASILMLVYAAKLITTGVNPVVACRSCIAEAPSFGS